MMSLLVEQGGSNDEQALNLWWDEIQTWRNKECLKYDKSPERIKPQQVIETLHKLTNGDAYVASDVVTGDGSIQMNIQELSTAMQYDIPVKIINLNNRFLGMVKQWQDIIYQGRHSNSYMSSVPDFAAIAEAYGHVGIRIETPDELEAGLQRALELKDRLVFVDINVDETEHVYPMQSCRPVFTAWLQH